MKNEYIYLETPSVLQKYSIYGHEVIPEEEFEIRQEIFNYVKERYTSYVFYIELPYDDEVIITLNDIREYLDEYATLTNGEYHILLECTGDVFGIPFWDLFENDIKEGPNDAEFINHLRG